MQLLLVTSSHVAAQNFLPCLRLIYRHITGSRRDSEPRYGQVLRPSDVVIDMPPDLFGTADWRSQPSGADELTNVNSLQVAIRKLGVPDQGNPDTACKKHLDSVQVYMLYQVRHPPWSQSNLCATCMQHVW